MKTLIALCTLLLSLVASAQMTPEQRALKRAEFDRRLRERILQMDNANTEQWMREMETAMEELMNDSMADIDALQRQGSSMHRSGLSGRGGVSLQWEEGSEGRTLTVTPASKDSKLDVQVLKGLITIKAETTTAYSKSQTSSSQTVPGDCDGDKVKTEGKDGKLTLFFPWKKSTGSKDNERKPLKLGQPQIDT